MSNPTNSNDTIDSRDVEKRIEELTEEREALEDDPRDSPELAAWDTDNLEELQALIAFKEQAEGYCEWDDGAVFIRDSYFKDYAQELAEEIGALDRSSKWPYNCIDWETAARELQTDYTSAEFDGVKYWVR